jgi:hypothetical protein
MVGDSRRGRALDRVCPLDHDSRLAALRFDEEKVVHTVIKSFLTLYYLWGPEDYKGGKPWRKETTLRSA